MLYEKDDHKQNRVPRAANTNAAMVMISARTMQYFNAVVSSQLNAKMSLRGSRLCTAATGYQLLLEAVAVASLLRAGDFGARRGSEIFVAIALSWFLNLYFGIVYRCYPP
jgi:hypothetical protein